MTEIADNRFLYEMFVRGHEDGGIAAQVEYRRIRRLGDEVLSDVIEPAVAIEPSALEGTPFQGLISEALIASVAANEAKAATIRGQAQTIERLEAEAVLRERDVQTRDAEFALAVEREERLNARVAALDAQIVGSRRAQRPAAED